MDPRGNIYELTDAERLTLDEIRTGGTEKIDQEKVAQLREDVARLDGYLKGRADSDAPKRGKGANKDLAG